MSIYVKFICRFVGTDPEHTVKKKKSVGQHLSVTRQIDHCGARNAAFSSTYHGTHTAGLAGSPNKVLKRGKKHELLELLTARVGILIAWCTVCRKFNRIWQRGANATFAARLSSN